MNGIKFQQLIDSDFFINLEYHLSKAFSGLQGDLKGFWCDGILLEEDVYSASNIILQKQIIAKAWVGVGGQDIYKMIIKFGPCALEKYLNGDDLTACLPNEDNFDWCLIQPGENTIVVLIN